MKSLGAVFTSVIITAVIVGGGVYLMQQSELNQLNEEINELIAQNNELAENISPVADNEENKNTFNWEKQNASFEYPENYNILESAEDKLAITTASDFPDGDSSVFWTFMEIDSSTSLAERLAQYSEEITFTQDVETIGDREFTKVTLYSDFGAFTYTRYLLEVDGRLLDYKVGEGEEKVAIQVLESIQF